MKFILHQINENGPEGPFSAIPIPLSGKNS